MKIDLSEKIIDLKGNVLYNGESVGRVLSQYLMEASTIEPLRIFKVSMALLDDKEIEIDKKDQDLINRIVSGSELPNILKARILTKLEEDAK